MSPAAGMEIAALILIAGAAGLAALALWTRRGGDPDDSGNHH